MTPYEPLFAIAGYAMGAIGMGLLFDSLGGRSVAWGVVAGLLWPLTLVLGIVVMTYDLACWVVLWCWLWVRER